MGVSWVRIRLGESPFFCIITIPNVTYKPSLMLRKWFLLSNCNMIIKHWRKKKCPLRRVRTNETIAQSRRIEIFFFLYFFVNALFDLSKWPFLRLKFHQNWFHVKYVLHLIAYSTKKSLNSLKIKICNLQNCQSWFHVKSALRQVRFL